MMQATIETPETIQSIVRSIEKEKQTLRKQQDKFLSKIYQSFGQIYKAPKRDSYHKINANGKNAEVNAISKIQLNKDILVSTSKHDVTIYTNEEQFAIIGKVRFVTDAVIKSKVSNNSLSVEIKHQEVGGTVADKPFALADRFRVLEKPLLIVCSGPFYTKTLIDSFNKTINYKNPFNTTYMISIEDFPAFVEHWKSQDVTNFEEIKKYIEKPETVYI